VEQSERGERVLEDYRQAIYSNLLPDLAGLSTTEIMARSELLGRTELAPHADALRAYVLCELEAAPRLVAFDRTSYESVPDSEALVSEALDNPAFLAELSRPVFFLWNPLRAAALYRTVVLAQLMEASEFRMLLMTDSVAGGPVPQVVNSDPERPTVAFATGPELLLVHLEYREAESEYLLAGLEWLRETRR